MKRLTLDQWEKKYIAGTVERFDQKYQMFNRPAWDPEMKELLEDWSFGGEARERPGYTLLDHALKRASSRITQLAVFNMYKPNPSPVTMAITAAMAGAYSRRQPMPEKPRERMKIDVSDPEVLTRNVKKAAWYFGADLVGVCRLDRRFVYSHTYGGNTFEGARESEVDADGSRPQEIPGEFQYAIVMGFEMDYDLMKYFPTYVAETTTAMGYSRMAIANAHLSAFIRGLGFKTIDCSINDVALSVPLAMQAGLGDIGRNGILITPQFGPRLRLSKVFTDLPLIVDAPVDFGVTEFCKACMKCAEMCPSQAISTGERTSEPNNVSNVASEMKWSIDPVKCRMHWGRTDKSCTICIACCPYNKPDTLFHRVVLRLTDYLRWTDSLCTRMDNLLGYGRPARVADFWEEWQPRRH